MSRITFILSALLTLSSCSTAAPQVTRGVEFVPPEVPQRPNFDPAQSAGIFVGVELFPTSERLKQEPLDKVTYAVDDAVDLAHFFSLQLRLIDAKNVRLLLSGRPSKNESVDRLKELLAAGAKEYGAGQSEIYALLDQTVEDAGPDGLLLVTLATHGFTTQNGQFFLAATSLSKFVEETGVSMNRLLHLVAEARAPRRLLLLDACRDQLTSNRSTPGVPDPRSAAAPGLKQALARAEGQAVLFAAPPKGYAYPDPDRENGVFTAAILDGLSCQAGTDEDGLVTARLLAAYVHGAVREWVTRKIAYSPRVPRGIAYDMDGEGADLPLAQCPPRVTPVRPKHFSYLVPDPPVAAETIVHVQSEVESDCPRGDFWLAFIDREDLVWPALKVEGRVDHKVALPPRFTGGELALICVEDDVSEAFRVWLMEGNESPRKAPGELKILLASPITIQR